MVHEIQITKSKTETKYMYKKQRYRIFNMTCSYTNLRKSSVLKFNCDVKNNSTVFYRFSKTLIMLISIKTEIVH